MTIKINTVEEIEILQFVLNKLGFGSGYLDSYQNGHYNLPAIIDMNMTDFYIGHQGINDRFTTIDDVISEFFRKKEIKTLSDFLTKYYPCGIYPKKLIIEKFLHFADNQINTNFDLTVI